MNAQGESAESICSATRRGVPLLVPGEVITQDVIDYVGQSGSQILKGSALFDGCLKVLT